MSNQIVFISPFPNQYQERDGMMQRVKAIDTLVADLPRVYLDISYSRNLGHSEEIVASNCKVVHVNLFLHKNLIVKYLETASLIYVHSAYNALKINFFFKSLGHKIITDIHGILPEELAFMGRRVESVIYSVAEQIMIKYSRLLISINSEMTKYLMSKYPQFNVGDRIIEVPILHLSAIDIGKLEDQKVKEGRLIVVYGGGIHKYQNIELMINSVLNFPANDKIEFQFFVPKQHVDYVTSLLPSTEIPRVMVSSLPRAELLNVYRSAKLGFVLRNDIPLNRVAMPTKLIEYMEYGIVPIVLSSRLGDLEKLGYGYLSLEEFLEPKNHNEEKLRRIRLRNYEVIANIERNSRDARKQLRDIFLESYG